MTSGGGGQVGCPFTLLLVASQGLLCLGLVQKGPCRVTILAPPSGTFRTASTFSLAEGGFSHHLPFGLLALSIELALLLVMKEGAP